MPCSPTFAAHPGSRAHQAPATCFALWLNMQGPCISLLTLHLQVVHSDLKAKNILLTKDQHEAKISDIGLAR